MKSDLLDFYRNLVNTYPFPAYVVKPVLNDDNKPIAYTYLAKNAYYQERELDNLDKYYKACYLNEKTNFDGIEATPLNAGGGLLFVYNE